MSIRSVSIKAKLGAVAGSIFIGLFWASMPLAGWSHYSLEGALTSCSVEWKERSLNVISYNITIFAIVYFVPVAIILFTSVKLLLIVSTFFFLGFPQLLFLLSTRFSNLTLLSLSPPSPPFFFT